MATESGYHTEPIPNPNKGSAARLLKRLLIALAVSLAITAVVFLPNLHLTPVNNRWITVVGSAGRESHIQSSYDVEIVGTWLVNTWSNLALVGYAAFALSPLGVFVFTAYGVMRQLRRIARGEVYPAVYRPFYRIRVWTAILLGLLPGLIAPGVYLGWMFQADSLAQFSVSDLEALRMVFVAAAVLLIWWSMNFVAVILGITLVAILRNPLGVVVASPVMLIFLGIALYIGSALTISSAPIEPPAGLTGLAFGRISALPIALTIAMQLGGSYAASYLWRKAWGPHILRRMDEDRAAA